MGTVPVSDGRLCPQVVVRQNGHCSWARQPNIQIEVNPTRVSEVTPHSVVSSSRFQQDPLLRPRPAAAAGRAPPAPPPPPAALPPPAAPPPALQHGQRTLLHLGQRAGGQREDRGAEGGQDEDHGGYEHKRLEPLL